MEDERKVKVSSTRLHATNLDSSLIDAIEPFHSLNMILEENHLDKVVIRIPLESNRNDKQTMFAGSTFSAMVLSGWQLVTNWSKDNGVPGPVVIKKTKMEFEKPAHSELLCSAVISEKPIKSINGNWKIKVSVEAVDADGNVCASFRGSYRALAPKSK